MNRTQLLQIILSNREFIRELTLTDRQLKVFKTVVAAGSYGITVKELSEALGLKSSGGYVHMNKLHKLGYLIKSHVRRGTKGRKGADRVFIYRARPTLADANRSREELSKAVESIKELSNG